MQPKNLNFFLIHTREIKINYAELKFSNQILEIGKINEEAVKELEK